MIYNRIILQFYVVHIDEVRVKILEGHSVTLQKYWYPPIHALWNIHLHL